MTMFHAAISLTLLGSVACKPSDTHRDHPTEVDKGNEDLAEARAHYVAATKERLVQIDAKIDELGARADADSKDAVAKLRIRLDELAAKLDALSHQAADGWKTFKQEVEQGADAIERDVRTAMK